jgi:5-methylcytosine-specific restriction endonuclease McrA
MTGELPDFLEQPAADARAFPASWRDAAIRASYDRDLKGVRCPVCADVFRRPAELRRLHGDHIVPYSRGGRTTWANLQLLCARCNLRKHAKV